MSYFRRISYCNRRATVSLNDGMRSSDGIQQEVRRAGADSSLDVQVMPDSHSDQAGMRLVGCCSFRFVAESRETVLQGAETDPEHRGGPSAITVHMLEGKFDVRFVQFTEPLSRLKYQGILSAERQGHV